jgi:hypothetical protein
VKDFYFSREAAEAALEDARRRDCWRPEDAAALAVQYLERIVPDDPDAVRELGLRDLTLSRGQAAGRVRAFAVRHIASWRVCATNASAASRGDPKRRSRKRVLSSGGR